MKIGKENGLMFAGVAALALAFAITPANAGLTAYWSFDVDFEEEIVTTTSHSREDWAGVPTIGPVGKFGNAVQSGSSGNGNTTVGYQSFDIVPAVLDNTAGTIEAWVNPNNAGTSFQMIAGSAVNGLWTNGIQLYMDPAKNIQAQITADGGGTRDWLEPTSGNAALDVGQWNHVAVVWSATQIRLYANGNLADSQPRDVGPWVADDNYFWVAGVDPGGGRGLDGGVDDVAVWNEERYVGSSYAVPTAPVPEPMSMLLLAAGGTLLRLRRRS